MMMGTRSPKKRKGGCFTVAHDRSDTESNSIGKSKTVCNQEENLISNESEAEGINTSSANLPNAANAELGEVKQLPQSSNKLREVESVVTNPGGFALAANTPEERRDDSDKETMETKTQERDVLSLPKNRTIKQELVPQMTEPPDTARPIQVKQIDSLLVSLSLRQKSTEEQDVNASGELTVNLKKGKTDVEIMQEPVSEKITNNQNLKQKLALRLDQHHPVVKNWEHLANALNVPIDIIAKCKINAEYRAAQRLLQFLEARKPNLMVKEFVSKLEKIDRYDIKADISRTLSDPENNTQRVSDVFNNNVQLEDKIVLQLDTKSPVKKGWKDLAYEFGLNKKEVERIESGCRNPAAGILDYLFKKDPKFTVGNFKTHMSEMKREDVLNLLLDYKDEREKLEKIMPRDSDLLEDVSLSLNKNAGGSLQNWRQFASRLKIPSYIYESYDPKNSHSPTEMLLDWLKGMSPEFTVGQLCTEIQNIDRNDVFELITK